MTQKTTYPETAATNLMVPSRINPRLVRGVLASASTFLFLLLLWMMFVSKWSWQEFGIGIIAALLGTLGDAIVKAEGFPPFQPRLEWLLLLFWEPWYVAEGSWIALRELARVLVGKQAEGRFDEVPFNYGGNDPVTIAKRALFAAFVTISPDAIVIGLDRESQTALIHELGPREISELAQRLGAEP